ncbi:leucine-rich repeat domain-containing protein [Erysipelotrichaceae bacterium OttesenSCG-928-M19]|nr:leucine-rich repeat domain-containing protein [Erysipelotrichaceae bacterium OttesenSCG-928-M19]
MKKVVKVLILLFFVLSINPLNAAQQSEILVIDGTSDTFDQAQLKNTKYQSITIKNVSLKTIPKEIYNNKQLEYLDLSNTSIKKLDNDISKLTKLKTIVLRNNQLTSIAPLSKLTNLEHLDVSGNNIYVIKTLAKHSKLKYVDLSYNALTSFDDISKLTSLKTLNLSNNQLIYLPKLPKKISNLNLETNYLNLNNDCCSQYKNKVVQQNKIVVRKDLSKEQIYYAMNFQEYTNQLLVSTNNKSINGFKSFVLKFNVAGKTYTMKEFIEKYQNEKNTDFTIAVDVIAQNNKKVIARGNQIYQYAGDYQIVQNQTPQENGFIPVENTIEKEKEATPISEIVVVKNSEDNYFASGSFKALSYIICLVFLVPLAMLCLVFIYLNKMNRDVDKVLSNH